MPGSAWAGSQARQWLHFSTGCTSALARLLATSPRFASHVLRSALPVLACPVLAYLGGTALCYRQGPSRFACEAQVWLVQLLRPSRGYNTLQGQQGGAPGAGAPGADGPGATDGKKPGDDNVVDAEFTDSDK